MTDHEGTPQEGQLDPESSTDEATADVNQETEGEGTTVDYREAAKELATADYQERLDEFDNVESAPVVSLPVKTPNRETSDEV